MVARLVIGGPKDGQRVCVDKRLHEILLRDAFDSSMSCRYRGEAMMGGGLTEPLVVFVVDGMTTGEALTRLVNYYKP